MSVADGWAQNGADAFNDYGDGSSEPFGVSGDVFGRELGDVDPFGNDSFDRDIAWGDFDVDDNDDSGNQNDDHHRHHMQQGNGRQEKSSSSSSSKTMKKKKSSSKGEKSEKSSSSSSKSSRKLSSTRESGRSPTRSSTSDSKTRSKSRSSRREHKEVGNGSTRHSSSSRRSGGGGSSSNGPEQPPSRAASFDTNGFGSSAFDGNGNDPFGIGEPSTPSRHNNNGFETTFGNNFDRQEGFADFGSMHSANNHNNNKHYHDDNNSQNHHDFADFGSYESPTKRPPRPRLAGATRHLSLTEDDQNQQQQQQQQFGLSSHGRNQYRRSSIGGSATSSSDMGTTYHAATASNRFRHSRRRDGTLQRLRPSEQISKIQQSDERRSAIKDSLFGALGGEDDKKPGVSLSNFLGNSSNRRGSMGGGGGGGGADTPRGSDAASVHSAPAAIRPPRHGANGGSSSRRSNVASHHDNDHHHHHHHHMASPSPHNQKSRRYQRKMGLTPTSRDTPTKQTDSMKKLDIAALAQQGYLEVQDGKMRLVIDLDGE